MGKPQYNEKTECWELDTGEAIETGDAMYIASEFIGDGVIYPFDCNGHDHEHCFSGVVDILMRHPHEFSIAGYEEYYSEQEKRMLERLLVKFEEER